MLRCHGRKFRWYGNIVSTNNKREDADRFGEREARADAATGASREAEDYEIGVSKPASREDTTVTWTVSEM